MIYAHFLTGPIVDPGTQAFNLCDRLQAQFTAYGLVDSSATTDVNTGGLYIHAFLPGALGFAGASVLQHRVVAALRAEGVDAAGLELTLIKREALAD